MIERKPEIRQALHLGDADRLATDYRLCQEMLGAPGGLLSPD
jgi:hypothetical protein